MSSYLRVKVVGVLTYYINHTLLVILTRLGQTLIIKNTRYS
jgi:hypothetical protein